MVKVKEMMQEDLIHNFWISNGGIIKIRESAGLTPFFLCHMKMNLFWNIDFYYEFNFGILLVFFFFHFHGSFCLKLFMCKNYASFFRCFVILSGKLRLIVKPRLCVFIVTHALILLAFVLSLVLSFEGKLTKILQDTPVCFLR